MNEQWIARVYGNILPADAPSDLHLTPEAMSRLYSEAGSAAHDLYPTPNEPHLKDVFPYTYSGGGYFRHNAVPIGTHAEILHGTQAIEYLYVQMLAHVRREP